MAKRIKDFPNNMQQYRSISPYLLILLAFCWLIGCQPDFQINADYQEELVVYCLLNPQDSIHYLTISRSVLNSDGETLDSIFRNPDRTGFNEPFEVWVEKWDQNGRIDHPILFSPDSSTSSRSAPFHPGKNTIYSSTRNIDSGFIYRLFIIDSKTRKTLTAACYTVSDEQLHYVMDNTYSTVTLESLDSVYFYQTEMYFNFVEVTEKDTSYRQIPLFKHALSNGSKKSGKVLALSLDRPDLFNTIGKSIEVKAGIRRYALLRPFEYRLILGDEVLFDYQNTLNISDQIYQTTQPITNIMGGKGIFSSVHRKQLGSIYMLDQWYTSLSENPDTKNLNFQPRPWHE